MAYKDTEENAIIGDTLHDVVSRVDQETDRQRLRAGAVLLNAFNYAIQVQAGRNEWTERDYHRFIRALVMVDGIGREAQSERETARVQGDVEDTLRRIEQGNGDEEEANRYVQEGSRRVNGMEEQRRPAQEKPSRQSPLSSMPNRVALGPHPDKPDSRLPRAKL